MAIIFMGVDGVDAGRTGVNADPNLGYADRIKTPGKLNSVIAGLGAGPHIVCVSGRYTAGDLTGSTMFGINAHANAEGLTVQAANLLVPAAAAPEITNYQVSTSAGEWTLVGTNARGQNVWRRTACCGAGKRVRRVFADDYRSASTYFLRELWESGTNSSATTLTLLYPNLGLFQHDWTQYNAAGTLTTDLYIASDINPIDRWGAVSWVANDQFSIFVMAGIGGGWRVDRSLVIRGGGDSSASLYQMGSGKFEADIKGSHFYQKVIQLQAACTGTIEFAPRIDPLVRSMPFYPGAISGWSVGSNHGIDMTDSTFSGDEIVVNKAATNGDPTLIANMLHAGVSAGLAAGKTLNKLRMRFAYHGSDVLYGRAYATGAQSTSQIGLLDIGEMNVWNQPTMCQPNGYNVRIADGRYHGKKTIGNGYVQRFGTIANDKSGAGSALGIYTITGTVFGRMEILRNRFECTDGGGINLGNFGPAFNGYLHVEGNQFVKTDDPDAYKASFCDGPTAMTLSYGSTSDRDNTTFLNNVAIGPWTSNPIRYFIPSVDNTAKGFTSPDIAGVNQGWSFYSSQKAFDDAQRLAA